MNKRLPLFTLFVASTLFGLTNILFRFAGKQNYYSVTFFILLYSAIIFLPFLKFSTGLSEVKSLKELRLIVLLGFFHAATWFLAYFAVMNTSIANAVLGYSTTPVFVIVLSPFLLKEHINRLIIGALVLALLGVLLIFNPRNLINSVTSFGIISGILAGSTNAMVQIIARKLRYNYSPLSMTFLAAFVGIFLMLPMFFLNGLVVPHMISMMIILLISLGGASAGTLLYYGLRHVITHNASIIMLLEPFISIVAASAIWVEFPSMLTILGATLLLIADIIIIRNQP